jgi:hypothetical protein
VLAQSSTPDQRRRAEEAKAAYFETAGVSLPAIPAFPAAVTDGHGAREVRYRRVTALSHKNWGS